MIGKRRWSGRSWRRCKGRQPLAGVDGCNRAAFAAMSLRWRRQSGFPSRRLVEPGAADARGAERMVVPSGLDLLPAHGREVRCVVGGNRFVCGNGAGRTTAYAELLLEHGGFPAAVVETEGGLYWIPRLRVRDGRWVSAMAFTGRCEAFSSCGCIALLGALVFWRAWEKRCWKGGVVESGDLFLAGFRREKSGVQRQGGDSSTDAAAGEWVTASR